MEAVSLPQFYLNKRQLFNIYPWKKTVVAFCKSYLKRIHFKAQWVWNKVIFVVKTYKVSLRLFCSIVWSECFINSRITMFTTLRDVLSRDTLTKFTQLLTCLTNCRHNRKSYKPSAVLRTNFRNYFFERYVQYCITTSQNMSTVVSLNLLFWRQENSGRHGNVTII